MATRASAHTAAPRSRAGKAAKPAIGLDMDAAGDSKARRYDPAETRARVLEAAYHLFGTRGYSGTGTADIAAQADVSEGSIFYHFGSKRALLVELGRLHGQKMTQAMARDDALDRLTFAESLNRCFDFCDANNVWEEVVHKGECPPINKINKKSPEAEPFFHATREYVVDWTKAHMDAVAARYGSNGMDTAMAANMVFALVGEAMHHYFAPQTSEQDRARIRAECIRFATAAAGHPAVDGPQAGG